VTNLDSDAVVSIWSVDVFVFFATAESISV